MTPRVARSVSMKELRADAAVLESVVLHHRYATAEELAPHRPGGAENPDKGARGWLRYYVKLQRIHSQREKVAPRAVDAVAFDLTERERMNLLRGAPVPVELLARESVTGAPAYLHVHPKSLGALTDCYQRDLALGWLSSQYKAIGPDASVRMLEARARMLDEMLYQQRVLCWIVCTPGPGLPFPSTAVRPQPPEEYTELDVVDVLRIIQAHQLVNSVRLTALVELYDTDPNPSAQQRPSWMVFVASMAEQLGLRTEVLINDWSLGELLAQHALVVKAQKDATEAAEAKRAANEAAA